MKKRLRLLSNTCSGMNDELNIPHCIKNYGADSYPTEEGFVPEEGIPGTPARGCKECHRRCLHRFQPAAARRQEEMEKLLKCCYYDTEVDF